MKKFHLVLIGVIALGGITVGAAFAATFNENVVINGKLTVNDGGFQFERTDNVQTTMRLINDDKQTVFQFEDPTELQKYLMRSTPGVAGNLEFLDFSGASPTARIDLAIERSSGNVGIGTGNPNEQLDVNGNLKVQGDILTTGIIKNPNGDLCLGSGCEP